MKTFATLIVALFLGVQFAGAQNAATATAKPAPAKEKNFTWNEKVHNFGKIPQKTPAPVTFTVNNNGTEPIVMTAAKSSCGCTVAEYTKEPIKPGETGIVKATYNAAHPGSFTKTVTVSFDGYSTPDVLTIKGTVEAPPPPPEPAPAPSSK